MATPRVCVLLSVFNGERFLREAVTSILNQTLHEFEFIIIDDGSTDSTASILAQFQDPRIVYVANDVNRGMPYSLNRGLAHATCDLIARFDGDDIAMPERIERQFEFLTRHPEVGVLGSQARIQQMDGRAVDTTLPHSHARLALFSLFACPFIHPSVMFRRHLVLAAGGYHETSAHADDTDLWFRMLRLTRFANLNEPLIVYRRHRDAVCYTRASEQACELKRQLTTFLEQLPVPLPDKSIVDDIQALRYGVEAIPDDRIHNLVLLLLHVFDAMVATGILKEDDLSEGRTALAEWLAAIFSHASLCAEGIHRSHVESYYWKRVWPHRLTRILQKLSTHRRPAPNSHTY